MTISTAIIFAVVAIGVLALIFGLVLGYASIRFTVEGAPLCAQIDVVLPQTQCGQCGYAGCKPYAEAIAEGDDINKCPPGGEATIKRLADLMGVEPKPLDAAHGEEDVKKVAFIREDECIGCTKCIQACPVDAILGAAKHMHTVMTDECTGCDLCVDPCAVDCFEMVLVAQTTFTWKWDFESSPKGGISIQIVS